MGNACLSILALMVLVVCSHAVTAQQIDLNKKRLTTKKLFEAIQKQSGYHLWYASALLDHRDKRSIALEGSSLQHALDQATSHQAFTYEIIGKTIVLKARQDLQSVLTSKDYTNPDDGETVNTGYGHVNKKTSTGSIARVGNEELSKNTSISLADRLSGRVPGLVVQKDGRGNLELRIRGQNSLQSGNAPLVVVDGLPYMGDLSILDPNTIQDVNVLKDADATTLYGSRGANGVVVITTTRSGIATTATAANTIKKRRDGTVAFDHAPAETVIEEVAQWYNMTITYTEPMNVIHYSGQLHPDLSANDVFKVLQAAGIALKVQGSTIIVLPQ
ncbi:MAG TPA: TonB-dependent receptor plug domain-containing protein [Flavobacteriaceae bacterium]|jgi:TonB-dependent SusC/RagA subfamily outer membrane receptor